MELITVTEYCGNDFVSTRQAYYFGPGHIEYLPEPPDQEINDDE